VYARVADCLSLFKDAYQMTTRFGSPASRAVDADMSTTSCTDNTRLNPWWYVDLGDEYVISQFSVTLPNVNGTDRKYQ